MSINVTVNGNPVSIKRGKMVTSDPNYQQKEQQKRRRMRLEQVRQQSQEIAESVRNKVKNERTKQLTSFEQENATKLKEWQNRKLIDLQSQYRDCLKDIGLGHTQALIEENEESEFLEKKEQENKGKARERGLVAKEKLQIEKNEKSLNAAKPKQIRKMVRDVENARSKMIADIAKNKNVEVFSEDEEFEDENFVGSPDNMHYPSPDVSRGSSPGMPRQNLSVRAGVDVYNTRHRNQLPKGKRMKGRNIECDDQFASSSRGRKVSSKSPSDCRMECLEDFEQLKSANRKRTKSPPSLSVKNRKSPLKAPQNFSDEDFVFYESFPNNSKQTSNGNFIESDENFKRINVGEKNRKFGYHVDEFLESDLEIPNKNKSRKMPRDENDEYLVNVEDYERSPNRKKSKSPKSKSKSRSPTSKTRPRKLKPSTDEAEDYLEMVEEYDRSPHKSKRYSDDNIDYDRSKARRDTSETSFMKKTLKFDEEIQSLSRATMTEDPPIGFPLDTRISDRIKSRKLPSICTNETLISRKTNTDDLRNSACQTEIPIKPKVCLKPCSSESSQSFNKIKTYDHANRFSSDLIVDNTVQKISQDSIEVCVDANEDVSYNKMKFKRDVDAGKRGRLALEKAKIQKDYEDLMQKLPVLQKQERLAALDPSKDKFHLSEERKKEAEKMRQKKIENVFEGMVGNVITIPKKNQRDEEATKEFVGAWSDEIVDSKATKNVEDSLGSWGNNVSDPPESLQNLLEKLRIQKELLMKETEVDACRVSKNPSKESTSVKSSSSSSEKPQFVSVSTSPIKKHKDKQKLIKKASPHKYRGRSRKEVLILQNMSTQTSPKTSIHPARTQLESKKDICNCAESDDKLCEILIKFQENEKPEVVVKSPEKMKESGVVIAVEDKEGVKMDKVLVKDNEKKVCAVQQRENRVCVEKNVLEEKRNGKRVEIKRDSNRRNVTKQPDSSSWSQNFSRNDYTTSSTSYFSPPDYKRNENLLVNPQKQTNVSNKTIDPRLLTYIKKLLTMSRNNLDNLSVSAVSEVSTPNSSVINCQSNNPTGKLLNVLKFFNLNLNDVMENLSKSGNSSDKTGSSGYNASHSGINETNPSFARNQNRNLVSERKPVDSSGLDQTDYASFNGCKQSCQNSKNNQSVDARSLNLDSYVETNYPDVLAAHYSSLADKCQQKISDITAKLLKVREEKNELLSPNNSSDKENATTYLNLPSHLGEDSSGNKSTSPEQRELTKKLLTVDINSLSNKLIENSGPREFNNDVDKDIIERYLKLLDEKPTNEFVPLLLDIPKLPKLGEKVEAQTVVGGKSKRPPPTKSSANNQLNFMPHELSTIVESDSVRKSKSPEKSGVKFSMSPAGQEMKELGVERLEKTSVEDLDLKNVRVLQAEEEIAVIGYNGVGADVKKESILVKEGKLVKNFNSSKENSSDNSEDINAEITPSSMNSSTRIIATQKVTIRPRSPISPKPGPSNCCPNPCNSNTCVKRRPLQHIQKSPLQQIIQKLQDISTDTSSDKSEVDIEAMLKNMGMGWAVATYRKTQEALAQQSSSSSLDTSKKKSVSASTSKSDNTISPFFKDLQDISAIQGSGVSNDRQHRTSTPVQSTKSSDKNASEHSGKMFSGESDLSSVKHKRDSDIIFVSMPNDTGDSTATTSTTT